MKRMQSGQGSGAAEADTSGEQQLKRTQLGGGGGGGGGGGASGCNRGPAALHRELSSAGLLTVGERGGSS